MNSSEILDLITRLSSEAEWSTEEMREAIKEDGLDPDEVLRSVLPGIKEIRIPVACNSLSDLVRLSNAGQVLISPDGIPASSLQTGSLTPDRPGLIARIDALLERLSDEELALLIQDLDTKRSSSVTGERTSSNDTSKSRRL